MGLFFSPEKEDENNNKSESSRQVRWKLAALSSQAQLSSPPPEPSRVSLPDAKVLDLWPPLECRVDREDREEGDPIVSESESALIMIG